MTDLTKGIKGGGEGNSIYAKTPILLALKWGHSLDNDGAVLRNQESESYTQPSWPGKKTGLLLPQWRGPYNGNFRICTKAFSSSSSSSLSWASWVMECSRRDHTPCKYMLYALSPHTHSRKRHIINKYKKMWVSSQSHLVYNPSHHWQPLLTLFDSEFRHRRWWWGGGPRAP